MNISVTGHRPNKLGGYSHVAQRKLFWFALQQIGKLNPDLVYTGMALGWDMAVAGACLNLGIPYVSCIPGRWQCSRWPDIRQQAWAYLLDNAQSVWDLGAPADQFRSAMQRRNEYMMQNGEIILALHNGSNGGTGNAVRYARSINKPVQNVWSEWEQFME
jgi:uncharacterized phage-like protein YoqJ